jgi:hypothetical protein
MNPFLLHPTNALTSAILILFLLLLLRLVLRRKWAAVVGYLLLGVILVTLQSDDPGFAWIVAAVQGVLVLFVLVRFGLLACFSMSLFQQLGASWISPVAHFPAWYAQPFVMELLPAGILAVYGFVISTAGRPIFREPILPE